LFAFLDSLAKVVLTGVPEPGGEAMEAAVARARGRHARLLKSAGQAMVGDSQLAMQDLVNRELAHETAALLNRRQQAGSHTAPSGNVPAPAFR
jgi:hypothetical protein